MSHSVFLVEDHPAMREAFAWLIGRADDLSLCGTATSAEDALDFLHADCCDVLITDISLPGMDGVAFIERVVLLKPALPIIAVSIDPDCKQQVRRAGARRFVDKCHAARQLLPTVREILVG